VKLTWLRIKSNEVGLGLEKVQRIVVTLDKWMRREGKEKKEGKGEINR
jgi:hypothetical protein